ncbi:MAG: sigma-70 family RNA polymerase sigma factor [Phycisphaerales bacterium]|nr:sigma-70 family RNA polymerase sigma factor [Phycisphaerales bacterium]
MTNPTSGSDQRSGTREAEEVMNALVHRAMEGDGAAFTKVLWAARDEAARSVARKVRQSARLSEATSTEDLLQDASFAAVRDWRRGMFKPEENGSCGAYGCFVKWFAKIAQNRVLDKIDELNAEKRGGGRARVAWTSDDDSRSSKLSGAVVDSVTTISRGARKRELIAAVQDALGRIRPLYRTVLEMKIVFGLSHREIGAEIGKEEATVRKLLSRAIHALSREVGDYAKYITRV